MGYLEKGVHSRTLPAAGGVRLRGSSTSILPQRNCDVRDGRDTERRLGIGRLCQSGEVSLGIFARVVVPGSLDERRAKIFRSSGRSRREAQQICRKKEKTERDAVHSLVKKVFQSIPDLTETKMCVRRLIKFAPIAERILWFFLPYKFFSILSLPVAQEQTVQYLAVPIHCVLLLLL